MIQIFCLNLFDYKSFEQTSLWFQTHKLTEILSIQSRVAAGKLQQESNQKKLCFLQWLSYTKPPDPNPRSRRQIYQLWHLFATNLSASLQSLCYNAGKNRSKVPSRKVTMHCPAPRCDSLKVRPMATSERKRVYWQLKTGLRRVHILQKKKKKKITPISAVDNKKKKIL